MKISLKIVLSTLLTLSGSTFSYASLVNNIGFTTDTRTGLDWLDLNETFGYSYEYVYSQLGDGGTYEGWSYASTEQLIGLLESSGGSEPYNGWSEFNNGVVEHLMSLWAYNESITEPYYRDLWSETREISILYGTPDSSNYIYPAIMNDITFFESHLTADFISLTGYSKHISEPLFERASSALVRVSAVPIPAAIWLFSSGLIGLLSFVRYTSIKRCR